MRVNVTYVHMNHPVYIFHSCYLVSLRSGRVFSSETTQQMSVPVQKVKKLLKWQGSTRNGSANGSKRSQQFAVQCMIQGSVLWIWGETSNSFIT